MTDTTSDILAVTAFIDRWERSGAAERSNHQLFISELCDLIGVPHPNPATPDTSQNAYIFERAEQLDAHRKPHRRNHPRTRLRRLRLARAR